MLCQLLKPTGNLGDGVDDVVEHCKETEKRVITCFVVRMRQPTRSEQWRSTLSGDVERRRVLSSVVTEHRPVDALIFSGELEKNNNK